MRARAHAGARRFRRAGIRRLVVEELADQVFEHDGRLRHRDRVAVLAASGRRRPARGRCTARRAGPRSGSSPTSPSETGSCLSISMRDDAPGRSSRRSRSSRPGRPSRPRSSPARAPSARRCCRTSSFTGVGLLERQRAHVAGLQREEQQRRRNPAARTGRPRSREQSFSSSFPKRIFPQYGACTVCALHNARTRRAAPAFSAVLS